MYIPRPHASRRKLGRRKGGGGGGKSSGSKGDHDGGGEEGGSSSGGKVSSGGSGEGQSASRGSSVPVVLSGGPVPGRSGSTTASAYGAGDNRTVVIPPGQAFAGRSAGGGTRADIYGTRTYGSGYPGISARGVDGRGLPFYFWPVVWGGAVGYGAEYLHDNEYGEPNNSSRPGGSMYDMTLQSVSGNTTVHVLADNTTVTSLASSIVVNCSSFLTLDSDLAVPVPYNDSSPISPKPEQAIQYYRASSIVLMLDGYNDTAALLDNASMPDAPVPSWANGMFLTCVNETIGAAAPLVDPQSEDRAIAGATKVGWPDQHLTAFVCLVWLLWTLI
ncbi:hypothetical protein GLOTRDRAFT_133640 [Gloeophyllum trabeum ATCC 11539]|uniref:Uncharacterized protein n=1 Tax=Gloeophyllum trabeum (strain ATCC 11539 / FP-39264 / Madison 617) TaxID=670483 RepID=S7PU96_GLOTA|nr:uncharacterized protein GLOTRDRAFT_133640 [Gloeophyllum trabeum ATCC 11539]EPQ50902.1 hypothetical protein GLOTRDRAFT_133640 [Gloeophyllum trabeum ATCC 11539]